MMLVHDVSRLYVWGFGENILSPGPPHLRFYRACDFFSQINILFWIEGSKCFKVWKYVVTILSLWEMTITNFEISSKWWKMKKQWISKMTYSSIMSQIDCSLLSLMIIILFFNFSSIIVRYCFYFSILIDSIIVLSHSCLDAYIKFSTWWFDLSFDFWKGIQCMFDITVVNCTLIMTFDI